MKDHAIVVQMPACLRAIDERQAFFYLSLRVLLCFLRPADYIVMYSNVSLAMQVKISAPYPNCPVCCDYHSLDARLLLVGIAPPSSALQTRDGNG